MKTIILAGGLGTRISEETIDKPKPMVLIDGRPILWHIMSIFASQGFDDFVIASGYRSDVIEAWLSTLETRWNIELMFTGLQTQTGGRIKMCMDSFPANKYFATYGDGLGNIDLGNLLNLHVSTKCFATVTAVRPPVRFGLLEVQDNRVVKFGEKTQADSGWINGGFFVLEPEVSSYITGVEDSFEADTLPRLVRSQELGAYFHNGFWKPMDTLREKNELEQLVKDGSPPWLEI